MNAWWHVIPMNDLQPHEDDLDCWCMPEINHDENLIIHNSLDGREKVENANIFSH